MDEPSVGIAVAQWAEAIKIASGFSSLAENSAIALPAGPGKRAKVGAPWGRNRVAFMMRILTLQANGIKSIFRDSMYPNSR